MAAIYISALITDGDAVLFETVPYEGDRLGEGGTPGMALPRYELPAGDDSIEEALSRALSADLGMDVLAQQFVDTLYERVPGSTESLLNNLQMVTDWVGVPFRRAALGRELAWAPIDALPSLHLPAELRTVILGTFGLAIGPNHGDRDARGRAIVVTGAAGAGKSTVARLVAEVTEHCAVIGLDALRHMVVSGAPIPRWEGGELEESRRFGALASQNAAALARNFIAAGFDVVIEGVLETPAELDLLLAELGEVERYLVTLMPDLARVVQRDRSRETSEQMGKRSRDLHRIFAENGEFRGLHLDSSEMTAAETAAIVVERLGDARL